MNYTIVAASIGVVAVAWHVTATIMIYEALRKRGRKVSFILLRLMAPKYAYDYKEVIRQETGKTGSIFYHWIVSINIALSAAIFLVVHQISR